LIEIAASSSNEMVVGRIGLMEHTANKEYYVWSLSYEPSTSRILSSPARYVRALVGGQQRNVTRTTFFVVADASSVAVTTLVDCRDAAAKTSTVLTIRGTRLMVVLANGHKLASSGNAKQMCLCLWHGSKRSKQKKSQDTVAIITVPQAIVASVMLPVLQQVSSHRHVFVTRGAYCCANRLVSACYCTACCRSRTTCLKQCTIP
jgi:hypothetical protein